jgi:hypothetical protein
MKQNNCLSNGKGLFGALRLSLVWLVLAIGGLPSAVAYTLTEFQAGIGACNNEVANVTAIDSDMGTWVTDEVAIMQRLATYIQNNYTLNTTESQKEAAMQLNDGYYMVNRVWNEILYWKSTKTDNGSVNVTTYGATGDGTTNDAAAIRSAIAYAKANNKSEVYFPAGTYYIGGDEVSAAMAFGYDPNPYEPGAASLATTYRAHLILENVKNLTLRGESGTMLLMGASNKGGIMLLNCERVTLKNLQIEYANTLVAQLTITSFPGAANTFDATLEPNFPAPNGVPFTDADYTTCRFLSSTVFANSSRPAKSEIFPSSKSAVTSLGNNVYRFTLTSDLAGAVVNSSWLPIGSHVVQYARNTSGDTSAIVMYRCKGTILDGVTIYQSPSLAVLMQYNDFTLIRNCKVTPRSVDGKRYVTTCADGFYNRWCHFGAYIKNCNLEFLGDDFLNVHGVSIPIYDKANGANGSQLWFKYSGNWRVGERLGIVKTRTGSAGIDEEAYISSVNVENRNNVLCTRVDLDRHLTGISTLNTQYTNTTVYGSDTCDVAVQPEGLSQGLLVRDNTFSHGASRILLGARNAAFRANTIVDTMMHWSFLQLGSEGLSMTQGSEFQLPQNVLVDSNSITSARGKQIFATISMSSGSYSQGGGVASTTKDVRHIQILNNTFIHGDDQDGALYPSVLFSNFEDGKFSGNTLQQGKTQTNKVLVKFDTASGINVADNTFKSLVNTSYYTITTNCSGLGWNNNTVVTDLSVFSNSPAKVIWWEASGATGYAIERKTGVSGTYAQIGTTAANVTTFWDTSVVSATTYYYRVKTIYPTSSQYSVEKSVTTPTFTTMVNDNFNASSSGAVPNGWTMTAPTNTTANVQAFPSATNKSIKLYDNSTTSLCSAEKIFTAVTDWTFASFSFYASANGATFQLRSGTTVAVDLLLKNGNLIYRNATGAETIIMAYTANTWYAVKVVPSVSLKTFDLYVGGALKVKAGALRNTVSNIDRITFGADLALTGTTYLDDVLIQK